MKYEHQMNKTGSEKVQKKTVREKKFPKPTAEKEKLKKYINSFKNTVRLIKSERRGSHIRDIL